MRKLYIFGLIALAALIIGLAYAEQMTLSTYYPAPYGVYNDMRVMNSLGIGTMDPGTNKLEIADGITKTTGGLIIETRDDTVGDPPAEELYDGRMWLRTDINP